MSSLDPTLTTGIASLDQVLKGLLAGDNIVWQVGSEQEYARFVRPYCDYAVRNGTDLIYFRFGQGSS